MDIDAMLFDVGGTVFDWRTAVIDAVGRIGDERVAAVDADDFSARWRKNSLIEIYEIAEETAPWRTFDEALETSLDQVLDELSIDGIDAGDRQTLLAAWERMPAWPEAREGLDRLRQRYAVAPLTILSLRAALFSSRRAGLAWDAIISCDALGAIKPHPESYRRGLRAIGRPAKRVCFVAAHPGDLRAAASHGMRTAYVKPRLEDWGDDYTDTGFADEFDIVADDFIDLADRMGA